MFQFVFYGNGRARLRKKEGDRGAGCVLRVRYGGPSSIQREGGGVIDFVVCHELAVESEFVAEFRKDFRIERVAEHEIRCSGLQNGLELLHCFLKDFSLSDSPD